MISDTLSEAVSEIDRYLTEMPDVYQGDLRARIVKVRNDMEAIREELDAPPHFNEEHQEVLDAIEQCNTGESE